MPHFFGSRRVRPHPAFRPILYHIGQFSGILDQKIWAAEIVFILLPSIFTRRNGRIVQTKPIRYEKTFPSSGHRCRHLGSIRRRISSEQPLFEAERYGTRGYGHEAQLRVDLVQPRRRLVSGHPIRHLGRHHRHRFEGHLYVAPRLYGQDQAAALHLGQQHCDPALRLFQLQTPRLDVGRPGFQYAVRLLDGLGRQLAGGRNSSSRSTSRPTISSRPSRSNSASTSPSAAV